MILPWRFPAPAACAATILLLACGVQAAPRILGFDYAGTRLADVEHLGRADLPGALKMSGTWVSKLSHEPFVRAAVAFCKFAQDRGQDAWIQVPVTHTSREVTAALDALAARGCRPKGFAIGNEVDRMVTERIAARYTPADYVADYNRIVPLVSRRFTEAQVIALELASFTITDPEEGDPLEVRYLPIHEWLVPFLRAKLVRRPDYVSVHFYPFTGAQKEWETLAAGRLLRRILADLKPVLDAAPPLLLGEFNTTYQYEAGTVYPGSGGESFMAALVLPEILGAEGVAGVFHWALADDAPSTLGLYVGREATPLANAWRLAGSGQALQVNATPFFVRGATTLPPLSITVPGARGARRMAYADRGIRSDEFSRSLHCAPLADFSQPRLRGVHFENARFNQNGKIGTGGTFVPVQSPGTRAMLARGIDHLALQCALPNAGSGYLQCGVKLPFVPDVDADRRQGVDWSHGLGTGSLRVTVASDRPVPVELHLEDVRPEAVGNNTHHVKVAVSGAQVIEVPLRQFSQAPGFGIPRPLQDVLRSVSSLRIETRQPGFNGTLRVLRVEVCDSP